MFRKPPIPLGQRWLDCVWPFPVAFSLTFVWPAFSSGSRPGIVRIVGAVDDRVLQVRRRDGVPLGKSLALPM